MFGLSSQMKRAAVSVPANIAEGLGRNYKKDTIQFLYISRGSLYELETLVHISEMLGMSKAEALPKIFELIKDGQRLVNGLITRYEKADLR
ncbi:MAG: four helix bundle protein [Citrobacter freundii]|nr:MAG: four helix bundle protein [Citrobacter freundii]